ncbi:hypothetical protein [Polaribacter sp. Asnod1-A03]|uniref:hypothetical protein n=1 Tax=Polaribacter sp. Asnod1-A03 TaxID=3160581 RepID=UPI003865CBEE
MIRTKEILHKQKSQRRLKSEIKRIKKKLPRFVVWFLFFVFISLYFFEDNFFHFFGNSVNIVLGLVISLSLFLLFFILRSYILIKSKQKESKEIGVQLYNLMKLESEAKDE